MPKLIPDGKERLLEEARRQILEHGYRSLTIRSVARACGIGTGTVYHYYPSKEALTAEFLLEDWKQELERLKELPSDALEALETVYLCLRAFELRYRNLFLDACARNDAAAVFQTQHRLLRKQLASVLSPRFPDPFLAEFLCEALITWSTEEIEFSVLSEILQKIIKGEST